MNWLEQHRLALGLILRRFARSPLSSLLAMMVIGVALSLPLGLYTLVDNTRSLAGNVKIQPQITVFLSPGASAGSAREIEARLKEKHAIRQFRFIPRDQAMQELLQSAGLADVAAGLDKNPLPDAFVIETLSTNPAELESLRNGLLKLPKVDSVLLDTVWAKRLNGMLRLGRDIALLLAAGDTFRAAAREQLQVWGERNNVTVITQAGHDSAAVIFDAIQAARARGIDIVLADTAGLLPTQLHLMEELKKIKRVIAKAEPSAPHEIMLVLDANTGQNAISQVKSFDDAL